MAGTVNSWNNQIAGSYNQIILNAGTNGVAISTDASAATVNVATGAAVKTTTLGSTNSTSATTVQSGSGALNVTSSNGALTINSGTGALSISNDASATTVNIATGGAAKVATLGSTNGASSLALKYGTADFSLASATGNVMVALDTGEVTKPLQPAFMAVNNADQSNVTGDGTVYTVTFVNEIYDNSNDFDGTSTFTAPVTGTYLFTFGLQIGGVLVANNLVLAQLVIGGTSAATYRALQGNLFPITNANAVVLCGSFCVPMTATDTAIVQAFSAGGTKVVDVVGVTTAGYRSVFFSGTLLG